MAGKFQQNGGAQPAGTATKEGANQVPSPVTPADWQGKHSDEHVADALDLAADRLPMRSRSPALVARGGAGGGASQKKNEDNGE